MNEQIVKNILTFLSRVQLTGVEAIAWCEAVATLNAKLNQPLTNPTPSENE